MAKENIIRARKDEAVKKPAEKNKVSTHQCNSANCIPAYLDL